MVRSVGILAVVVGLAWTGLAGAQSSSPLEKAHYINVSEEGKSPQRCKLVKTWHDANGAPVFQVQAVDTGEMMTIVGTAPKGAAGDSREMTTRIFRWGSSNMPPAGAPVPPQTTTTAPKRTQPVVVQKPQTMAPQPSGSAPVAAPSRLTTTAPVAQKPSFTPASTPTKTTISPNIQTSSKPATPTIINKAIPVVSSKPESQTPTNTHTVQYASPSKPAQLPEVPSKTEAQPRLSPLAAGTVINSKDSSCACPMPCDACSKPCAPCAQSACVTCTPTRKPILGRLLKSKASCPCTTVVTQTVIPTEKPATAIPPGTTVVTKTTEPAQPNDWRQSWGNVEPYKGSTQSSMVHPVDVSKRVDAKPVTLEPSTNPDPLKAPDQYRDIVMNSRLSNSKIPPQSPSSATTHTTMKIAPPPELHANESMPPAHPGEIHEGTPGMQQGRMIVIDENEPNAFWSPKKPSAGQVTGKINAFDRASQTPPQATPPMMAGVPPRIPRVPPDIPGVAINMLPPRVPTMNMPTPPLPVTAQQRGPVTMMPDTGVANALGNAFTLPGTSRPIPADFGGTPQEPNGFDPSARVGQGMPPQGYGMGMPGGGRPQMANAMAMNVNPLMNVPQASGYGQAVATSGRTVQSGGVPQLLATLKDSLRPSEREAAAEQLSELNWQIQPLVVESLMKSARADPAASVRASCVHALAHMKVNTPEAIALVRDLKLDRDAQVRQEAEEALNTLGDTGVQQASHK